MGSKAIKFRNKNNDFIYPCPYFPVGSIYMSFSSTNPSTYFGGTWELIKDRFLLGAGNSYSVGSTGGEKNHQLTNDEMPTTGMIGVDTGSTSEQWTIGEIKTYPAGSYKIGRTNINRGAHNNMPPYIAVYIWRRTA